MSFRRVAKVDDNQKEIVDALRKIGAYVLHTHQLKNAFDVLVVFRGNTTCLEIKDGSKFPKKFELLSGHEKALYVEGLLTGGEKECMSGVLLNSGRYRVAWDIDSAIKAISS